MKIRARRDDDLPRLVEALAHVAWADGYPSRWPHDPAAWLRSRDLVGAWVVERDDAMVGHVVLRRPHGEVPVTLWCAATGQHENRCAVVVRLFVVPAARGAGLGHALLATAHQEAARRGLHPVLDVVDTNRSAVRLYDRLGWTRLGSYQQRFHDDGPPELLLCFAAPYQEAVPT